MWFQLRIVGVTTLSGFGRAFSLQKVSPNRSHVAS